MSKVAQVVVDIPPGSFTSPDNYCLSAKFHFGEAQVTVTCLDEQTGEEKRVSVQFDSSEVTKDQLVAAA